MKDAAIPSAPNATGPARAPEQIAISESGMTCGHCVETVSRALKEVDGVTAVQVNLANGVANAHYDPSRASIDDNAKYRSLSLKFPIRRRRSATHDLNQGKLN
jgi:copper chaperone CopZ